MRVHSRATAMTTNILLAPFCKCKDQTAHEKKPKRMYMCE